MTVSKLLSLLAAAPALAVFVGLVVRARTGVIVTVAVVGELLAYFVLLALSNYAVRHAPLTEGTLRATVDVDMTRRVVVLLTLAIFALLVAGAGIGLRRLIARLWP